MLTFFKITSLQSSSTRLVQPDSFSRFAIIWIFWIVWVYSWRLPTSLSLCLSPLRTNSYSTSSLLPDFFEVPSVLDILSSSEDIEYASWKVLFKPRSCGDLVQNFIKYFEYGACVRRDLIVFFSVLNDCKTTVNDCVLESLACDRQGFRNLALRLEYPWLDRLVRNYWNYNLVKKLLF